MSFKDIEIKREYRSLQENVVKNFFMPLMSEAKLYQRAVGFFSSTALACYSQGISELIKNNGRIELVASPKLSVEDIEAINMGYQLRDDIIERNLIDSLMAPVTEFEKQRLNMLATYIADEKLEIKIAFVDNNHFIRIYHEKLGLFYDYDNNIVSFTGSMNESENGFNGNYETIDVFCSWYDMERVQDKVVAFENIWEGKDANVTSKRFPDVEKVILRKYMTESRTINYHIDEEEYGFIFDKNKHFKKNTTYTIAMSEDTLYQYQKAAIENWSMHDFCGIYDMCTGAGKTYTAIGSIKKLYEEKGRLAVIIVVPYQHLVEQWVDDLEKYNIHPIVGYSDRKHKNYRSDLKKAVFDFDICVKNFICFICTNATFAIDVVQRILSGLKESMLLVVDEAHNFGAESLSKTLYRDYQYKLALSATLERYGDPEGTAKLYHFFGKKCIEYTLEQAIRDGKLTEYYYYPKIVYLTDDELEKYNRISQEMKQYIYIDKSGNRVIGEKAKRLAIKRARIVAGAYEKIAMLKEVITPYKNDNSMLVYCGSTTLDSEELDGIDEDIRQIDFITQLLGEELDMNVAQFTSKENMEQRKILINKFKEGNQIQALIAIKCLDEGVNIPSIKTAFILASTTNPKEYIQRRGRVLRRAENKDYAVIYDMVTLPRRLHIINNLMEDEYHQELSMVRNELKRVEEFKRLSLNPYDSNEIIDKIKDAYDLYDNENTENDFMMGWNNGNTI